MRFSKHKIDVLAIILLACALFFTVIAWEPPASAQYTTPPVTTIPTVVNGNTNTPTYRAASNFGNSTAGDIWCIYGVASSTINVKRIRVTAIAAQLTVTNISLIRRSVVDTGGGLTAITPVASDPNNQSLAATSANVMSFTGSPGAPAPGAAVGHVADRYLTISQNATNVVSVSEGTFEFASLWDQAQVLRSATQGLCLNVTGTISGGTWSVTAEYTKQ